jgi:hypothetical protein
LSDMDISDQIFGEPEERITSPMDGRKHANGNSNGKQTIQANNSSTTT